ncbi:hypothetical protein GALMADRAFT_605799 [Galerina marginata CBS 339.88]|uniref:Uncharacterized protein n=1 Tax=Galerina marginata (strain CBS 339.88) TaxID=685588 RepID=A0A067T2I9_GALM3|nr:hypothetical protein GALMADRAFT_605799 [Galerina marginata CBS 339.88]
MHLPSSSSCAAVRFSPPTISQKAATQTNNTNLNQQGTLPSQSHFLHMLALDEHRRRKSKQCLGIKRYEGTARRQTQPVKMTTRRSLPLHYALPPPRPTRTPLVPNALTCSSQTTMPIMSSDWMASPTRLLGQVPARIGIWYICAISLFFSLFDATPPTLPITIVEAYCYVRLCPKSAAAGTSSLAPPSV